jgi:hypothetical protein
VSNAFVCPVCGYRGLSEPPRDGDGGSSDEICRSCGFQFGHSDDLEGFTYEQWRQRWIDRGMPWDSASIRPAPADWNPTAQLAALLGSQ